MKQLLFLFCLITVCCKQRNIVHSGLNNLVVGVQQIVLYDDNRFYLELSLGGTEGSYTISNDTIFLKYEEKPSKNWPDELLITKGYFESIKSDSLKSSQLKISRNL